MYVKLIWKNNYESETEIIKMFNVLIKSSTFSQARTQNWKSDTYGTEWVVFADSKGKPHYVNLTISDQSRLELKHLKVKLDGEPTYWLYTRKTINKPEQIFPSVKNSTSYIRDAPLVIVTHGWTGHRDVDSTQLIKNAILTDLNRNHNVVIMDWSGMENNCYVCSAYMTLKVGEKLKDFVKKFAYLYKVDKSKIHLIGHSLGAHVVGLAGAKLKENNFLVSRVTGLDPARPFFELPKTFPGITNNSAAFVDIIHTSVGILGICKPAGHADFYPGGGMYQPALCPSSMLGVCEHSSSYIYFVKSFKNMFQARKCQDYFMYSMGLCDKNEKQYMGHKCTAAARGSYFLDVININIPAKLE